MTQSPTPASKPQPSDSSSGYLVLYGVPPEFQVLDAQGRSLGKRFQLNKSNMASFEAALKIALGVFLAKHADLSRAKMLHVRNAEGIAKAIKAASARTHIIYYGHAIADDKALAPSKAQRVTIDQLVRMLKVASVSHFDLLGCTSVGIAAELAIAVPKIRFGGLMNKRNDDFEVDFRTLQIRNMAIAKQEFLHFGAAGR